LRISKLNKRSIYIYIVIIVFLGFFSFTRTEEKYVQRWNSIVFSKYVGDYGQIFIMGIDGSEITQLTFDESIKGWPVFSPDGKKIAFVSANEMRFWYNCEIYIMNVDGSGIKRLTYNDSNDGGPVFSPDGKKILFHSNRNGDYNLFIMNIDGSNQKQITTYGGRTPCFSPDGQTIAYHRLDNGIWKIYIINIDGSGFYRLTSLDENINEGSPCFSPDGKKIIFHANPYNESYYKDEIYITNIDGSGLNRLTNNNVCDAYPVFSPDGRKIAFESGGGEYGGYICIMNIDGSERKQLTYDFCLDPAFSPMLINGRLLDIYGYWHEIGE